MKHPTPLRLLTALLVLALAVSLFTTAALADTVQVSQKTLTGQGQIIVTVYDAVPDSTGDGTQLDSSPTGELLDGVGINAVRAGSVVELTTTVNGAVKTQIAFGISTSSSVDGKTMISLLGLDGIEPIVEYEGAKYYTPTQVQSALRDAANQTSIEAALNAALQDGGSSVMHHVTGELEGDSDKGVATFTVQEAGIYLLAKSALPADATTDLVPFLVSVPMYVEGEPGTWNSTVYAYPKVRTETLVIEKSSEVNGDENVSHVNAGDIIDYTISVDIPATEIGMDSTSQRPFTAFKVVDTNENQTLRIVNADGTLLEIGESDVTAEGFFTVTLTGQTTPPTLFIGTDYTVTYHGAAGEHTPASTVLTIEFTETGLEKLNAGLGVEQTLTISYKAKAATDVAFQPALKNSAEVIYDRGSGSVPTEGDENTLYTYGIALTKTLSEGEMTTDMAAAITFGLYSSSNCADEDRIAIVSGTGNSNGYWRAETAETPEENQYAMAVSVNEDGSTGSLYIYGLEPGTYYLKELTTCAGYTLLETPIKITITATTNTNGEDPTAAPVMTATVNDVTATVDDGMVLLTVENTQNTSGFNLPKTGGAGTLAAIAIGLGLLSCGVILLVVYRKKASR